MRRLKCDNVVGGAANAAFVDLPGFIDGGFGRPAVV